MPKNKYGGVFEPCICYWEKPVEKLPIVKKASRNNMYILPDDTMWVLSHAGDKYVEVGGGGGSKPTLLKNTDGYLVIDGNGTYLVDIDLDEDKLIELISKQLPFDKVGEGLQIDENSTLKVVLSPDDIGAQQKLTAGTGIVIDNSDPDKPIISTKSNARIFSNGTEGIAIADDTTAVNAKNSFIFNPPGVANPKATIILRRDGGMLNVVALQPYLIAGNGIKIDETNPKAPVISATQGDFVESKEKESGLMVFRNTKIKDQDWNTIYERGFYYVGEATGANAAGSWGYLLVQSLDDTAKSASLVQIFLKGNLIRMRQQAGSGPSWSTWVTLLGDNSIATQEEADKGESLLKLISPKTMLNAIKKKFVSLTGDQDVEGTKNFKVCPTVNNRKVLVEEEIKELVFDKNNTNFIYSGEIRITRKGQTIELTYHFIANKDVSVGTELLSLSDIFVPLNKRYSTFPEIFDESNVLAWFIWNERKFVAGNGLRELEAYFGSMSAIAKN